MAVCAYADAEHPIFNKRVFVIHGPLEEVERAMTIIDAEFRSTRSPTPRLADRDGECSADYYQDLKSLEGAVNCEKLVFRVKQLEN